MYKHNTTIKWLSILLVVLILTNCGGGSSGENSTNSSTTNSNTTQDTNTDIVDDEFSADQYNGLHFYYKSLSASEYKLKQLSDATFNTLNEKKQLLVANKLLSTLFFGYPLNTLKKKIATGNFIENIRNTLNEDYTDKEWLENHIVDNKVFSQRDYNEQVSVNILTRFYAMKNLDSYFLNNWVAYILTQTIMFSPAYELESTHTPNIARVYNRLVNMLNIDSGMRYITYVHMMSEDNWRRFRSPEDNGREMLEIFTLDMDDSHVPLAGQALKNWKLDRESDTLVVSLNQNRKPLKLFDTTIYNGDDFYRELAKSDAFSRGVTTRLVEFFFPNSTTGKKTQITSSILSSKPETWQDILLQIVFSEEYLLHSSRAKSAEELFFSMAKKIDFKHRMGTFHELKYALEEMHQASMKYKLGKLKRVPLDTLSFANYHKYIRERVLLIHSNPKKLDEYDAWDRQGWGASFISTENFTLNKDDIEASLHSFINYLFRTILSRNASQEELVLFDRHMIYTKDGEKQFHWAFNIFATYDIPDKQEDERRKRRANIAIIVLDYISRLSETYTFKEVK